MSYPPPPEDEPSQPGSSGPQQPQQPGQPPYGQPGYGQPQYGQPQYGQPQYGQPQYGQPQYGQGGYGQPGQPGQPYGYDPNQPSHDPNNPYGYGQASPYQQGYYPGGPRPEHPGSVPSLIIGIIALAGGVICAGLPLVLGPWAWVKGRRTMHEIDASGGQLGGRGLAQGGMVCGIVATVLLVLALIFVAIGVTVSVADGPSNPSRSSAARVL
jgi:hypothetical protein